LNRTNSWKIRTALVAAVAIFLALGAVAPSVAHFTGQTTHVSALSASASSYDPIATGNWQQDQYDSIIVQQAQSHNLDPFVVKGVIMLESAFNPYAVSQVINAACGYTHDEGLMQVNPVCSDAGGANLFDPWTNINLGTAELGQSYNTFGSISLALQAYNIGTPAVQNGQRNWAYSSEVMNYAQQFENEHAQIYGWSAPAPTPAPSTQASTTSSPSPGSEYTVRQGDTLYAIGQRSGIYWQTIATHNGIGYPYTIYVGQVLSLPSGSSSQSDPKYTVHAGDSLYSIGQKYGVTWQQIAQWNGVSSPYLIRPGEVLSV
jgi:LysM repeat protein